jgi:hypothetical protein
MHNNIASVDQHPITLRQAFDTCRAEAPFLQPARKVFGERRDVTSGPAGGEYERVRERGSSGKVNGQEVFGFVVFERRPDSGNKRRLEMCNVIGKNSSSLDGQGQLLQVIRQCSRARR